MQAEFDFNTTPPAPAAAKPRALTAEERERLINKLKGLLRLANSDSATAQEAALALDKAAEIATRHQIDLAAIGDSDEALQEELIHRKIRIAQRGQVEMDGTAIASTYFNVSVVWIRKYNHETWQFENLIALIGTELDVTIAQYVIEYIVKAGRRALAAFRESEKRARRKNTATKRKAFVNGFYIGVHSRLAESRKAALARMPIAHGTALATTRELSTHRRADFLQDLYPETAKITRKEAPKNQAAARKGFVAGRQTHIRTPLASTGAGDQPRLPG